MKKLQLPGFTLIELLIVIGVLAILLSIVLIAVNPFEQINKSADVSTNAVATDFASAVNYYYTDQNTYPWVNDPTCRNELANAETLADIPSCVKDLTGDSGQLQSSYMASKQTSQVYVTECNNAVALCYNPQSQQFNQSSDTKYTKNGVFEPGCPSSNGTSKNCYSCTFSTNDAQECFQALNPNGSVAIVPSPTPDQPIQITTRNSTNSCSNPGSGSVSCMAKVVTDSDGTPLSSLAVTGGYGPIQIHTAYNLPCTPGGPTQSICPQPAAFGPQTIALVDAYDDPTAEADLATYDNAYGLPTCSIANGCLTIVNEYGTTSPLPPMDPDWSLEESLDVQMAHAVCQTCKILLVEAQSNSFADIEAAENRAAQMGASAISNSYGAFEWSGETGLDAGYNHPGIFITASSGDWGYGVSYPAASKHVIAVGGTTLYLYSNYTYASESVWSGAGSGCSLYETANTFQTSVANWNLTGCGTERGIADVSADADPSTGVSVYDSTYSSGPSGWWIVGGTSVSSPIVSSALVLVGSAPATGDSSSYVYANPFKFRDVLTGSNGSCGGRTACTAAIGYDGPTGLGSPDFGTGIIPSTSPGPIVTPTPGPTATPTPTIPPGKMQVWLGNYAANSIPRYFGDGTSVGSPITGNGLNVTRGMAVVNQTVWVENDGDRYISIFNFDGSSAGGFSIAYAGCQGAGLAVVGSQVWLLCNNNFNIYRFYTDGTSAGPPLTGNGLDHPFDIAVVGQQVWVTNDWNKTISRFNFDGTSAGTPLAPANMAYPEGLAVVGTQVWVVTESPTEIFRLNFDGTQADVPITQNMQQYPFQIAVVGQQVWVTNTGVSNYNVTRYNFDGSSAGSPLTGNGQADACFIVTVP